MARELGLRARAAMGVALAVAVSGVGVFTAPAASAATTYDISTSSGNNMLAGTSDTGNHCDDCVTAVVSPFPLRVYGQQYSQFSVSSNGNMQFTTASARYDNGALPSTGMGVMVAPYWDDMRTDAPGNGIFTAVYGAAPYRQYVVEWRVNQYSTGEYANFEVIFNESNDTIVTRYGSTGDSGGSTTIGVQDGAAASTYAYNQPSSVFEGLQVNYLAIPSPGTTSQETAAFYDGWLGGADETHRISNVANHTATYKFSGTGVTWVTRMGPAYGKAAVTIDGVSKGTVDLYSPTPKAFSKSYTGLSTGTHTITVKVTGTKNPSSRNTWVSIDAFRVGTTTVQDNSWLVRYNAWYGGSSASASGGFYRHTSKAGSTLSFTFSGTAIDWITAMGPGWGMARVYIDGVDKGIVDLYSATQRWQAVKTYAGLAPGTHKIEVRPLGTKNAASSSARVVVDAFVVR